MKLAESPPYAINNREFDDSCIMHACMVTACSLLLQSAFLPSIVALCEGKSRLQSVQSAVDEQLSSVVQHTKPSIPASC